MGVHSTIHSTFLFEIFQGKHLKPKSLGTAAFLHDLDQNTASTVSPQM